MGQATGGIVERPRCYYAMQKRVPNYANSYQPVYSSYQLVPFYLIECPNEKLHKNNHVAVSPGYDTCFTVKACDGLYQLILKRRSTASAQLSAYAY